MKSKYYLNIILLLAAVLLPGCKSMKCKFYPGKIERFKKNDLKQQTIWQYNNDVFSARATGPDSAVAASLKWDPNTQTFTAENRSFILSKLGETHFLNVKGDDGLYTILKIISSIDGSVILFTVDAKKLEKDFKDGKIKGEHKGDNYILNVTKEELDKYIKENYTTLFDHKSGGVLKPLQNQKRNYK